MITADYLIKRYQYMGYNICDTNARNIICAVNPVKTKEKGTVVVICNNMDNLYLTKENIEYIKKLLAEDKRLPAYNEVEYLFVVINRWPERELLAENVVVVDSVKQRIKCGSVSKNLKKELLTAKEIIKDQKLGSEKHAYRYNLYDENHAVVLTYILVTINILAYIIFGHNSKTYGFSKYAIMQNNNYLNIFIYMFMHNGIFHLLGNMVALCYIGSRLEKLIGGFKMFCLYIVSGLYGAVVSALLALNPYSVTVGASGAIYGLLGAWIIKTAFTYKYQREYDLSALIKMLLITLISGLFLFGTDNACHIGGLIGGILFAIIFQLCDYAEDKLRHIKLQRYFFKKG